MKYPKLIASLFISVGSAASGTTPGKTHHQIIEHVRFRKSLPAYMPQRLKGIAVRLLAPYSYRMVSFDEILSFYVYVSLVCDKKQHMVGWGTFCTVEKETLRNWARSLISFELENFLWRSLSNQIDIFPYLQGLFEMRSLLGDFETGKQFLESYSGFVKFLIEKAERRVQECDQVEYLLGAIGALEHPIVDEEDELQIAMPPLFSALQEKNANCRGHSLSSMMKSTKCKPVKSAEVAILRKLATEDSLVLQERLERIFNKQADYWTCRFENSIPLPENFHLIRSHGFSTDLETINEGSSETERDSGQLAILDESKESMEGAVTKR